MMLTLFILLSCRHGESSLQQLMAKTDERFLYEGLLSESEDIRITSFSSIFEWGTEKEKESFWNLGLQDSSVNVRWIVEQNLDANTHIQNDLTLPIRRSEKCMMALWQPQWNQVFSSDELQGANNIFCDVWKFENIHNYERSTHLSGLLPSTKYAYRTMVLMERNVEESLWKKAVENALDTSQPLIIATWSVISDDGLHFLKKEILEKGKKNSAEDIDFESICSELSSTYLFLKRRNHIHSSLLQSQKLTRIEEGLSLLQDKNTYCSLQSLAIQGKMKRILSKLENANSLRELLFILPAIEFFLTVYPPKEKEKYVLGITEQTLPLLQDSEALIRIWVIRVLARTQKRNIRYLQQLEEERLDIKIEIIRAIRMLNASG
jgi:hypothetical protein